MPILDLFERARFKEVFEIFLELDMIVESEDCDVILGSGEPHVGWFVTPKARIELEKMLKRE